MDKTEVFNSKKIMKTRKAIYYGKVELIPGIFCDGYVRDVQL
jgi:hypothetical protein